MKEAYKARAYEVAEVVPEPKAGFPLWQVFAGSAAVGMLVAAIPALLPGLTASISAASQHSYWYISRASAFVAFALLWISMMAGLGITSKLSRFWPGMPTSFEIHRFTSLLGIGFGLVHALVLLGDQYMNYSLGQLLIPFMGSNYRPEWVGFGQLAFYILVVVAFSFYVRDKLGVHAWRLIHMLSFALFLMVLVHGVQSGTDSSAAWAQALYWTSGLSVLLGSIYRAMAHRISQRHHIESPAVEGLVLAGGRAQLQPAVVRASEHPATLRGRIARQ